MGQSEATTPTTGVTSLKILWKASCRCLDLEIKLPAFHATDLSRLPPVDADHCDISIILRELQSLRAEVRAISDLRAEVDMLRQEVSVLNSPPQIMDNTSAFASAANDIQNTTSGTDFGLDIWLPFNTSAT